MLRPSQMLRWLGLLSGFILLQKHHWMAIWGVCRWVPSNGERYESLTVVKWASDGETKAQ